jgi:iron complex outermembrane receptor protein
MQAASEQASRGRGQAASEQVSRSQRASEQAGQPAASEQRAGAGRGRRRVKRSLRRLSLAVGVLAAASARAEDEVVVRGDPSRPAALSRDETAAGSVITGPRLRAPGLEAADLLRGQPGLSVASTGGHGSLATASIRGATAAETPVYFAGVRLNDDVGGTADLSTVPLALVDRVEIYRGNAPLQADRLGIGGALFFDPRRPRRPALSAAGTLGSYGLRGLRGTASWGDEHAAALVSASTQRADNDYAYRDDRGTRFDSSDDRTVRRTNADAHDRDVWAHGRLDLDPTTELSVLAHHVEREQGVPGLGLLPTRAARSSLRRDLAAVSASRRGEDGRWQLDVQTATLLSAARYDDPLRELSLGATGAEVGASRVEQSVTLRRDLGETLSVTPAVRVASEGLRLQPDGAQASGARRLFSRVAVRVDEQATAGLGLHALGSSECHGTSTGAPGLCDRWLPSGRVGAVQRIGAWSLLANAGRHVRGPTLGEMYGISGTVRGSPDLRPERGLVADLGVRGSGSLGGDRSASVDAFVFAQRIDDLVSYRRSSLGYLRPFNVGQSRTLGAEFQGNFAPVAWFVLGLSLTVLDPRDTTPGRPLTNSILPFRSRLTAAPSAELRVPPIPALALSGGRAALLYVHQSSRYADPAGLELIPAQGSLDLELEARLSADRIGLRARATNLLAQSRFDVIGYPLPGRSLAASLELTWP